MECPSDCEIASNSYFFFLTATFFGAAFLTVVFLTAAFFGAAFLTTFFGVAFFTVFFFTAAIVFIFPI